MWAESIVIRAICWHSSMMRLMLACDSLPSMTVLILPTRTGRSLSRSQWCGMALRLPMHGSALAGRQRMRFTRVDLSAAREISGQRHRVPVFHPEAEAKIISSDKGRGLQVLGAGAVRELRRVPA